MCGRYSLFMDEDIVELQRIVRETEGKLSRPACTASDIFDAAFAVYQRNYNISRQPLRRIGVRGCGLIRLDTMQMSLFPSVQRSQKR